MRGSDLPRWNFSKANWQGYSTALDKNIRFIAPLPNNYQRFVKMVISTAKKHIPRGVRKEYIPCWTEANEILYADYLENGRSDVADSLLHNLDEARKEKWNKTTKNMNFRHSSRRAWSLLKKLGADSHTMSKPANVTADQVANHIVNLSRTKKDKSHSTEIKKEFKSLKNSTSECENCLGNLPWTKSQRPSNS